MPLHLIKLSVGAESIDDLKSWVAARLKDKKKRGQKPEHIHTTRMVPKRVDELLDGGSIYWVIKGQVACRERIVAIRPIVDREGIGRCQIVLDGRIVPVLPRPHRAFQGWRYLAHQDIPEDLKRGAPGITAMPEQMRRELRELGLL